MDTHLSASLDNLELGNLNSKLKAMRDKLRQDIAQDLEDMHFKMNLQSGRDSHASESIPTPISSSSRAQSQANQQPPKYQPTLPQQNNPLGQLEPYQPQYYINVEIAEQPIDFEEVRRLSTKKISEAQWGQYIRCSLKADVVDKLKELFQEMEDEDYKVKTRDFVQRINKLGVRYSQASAMEVPIIKRVITLKKVLFQLCYKTKQLPERIQWRQLKEALQDYRFPAFPTIDAFMAQEGPKARNHFNLLPQVVNELKNIYFKSLKEMFLSYCPLSSLLSKLNRSKVIQNNLKCMVRPKANYEVEVSLKDTIQYMTKYAPEFIDQDQFLLFFTVKGFSYYPIQQRANTQSTLDSESGNNIKRVKSEHLLPKDTKKKHSHFDQYFLSTNNPNSIRNQRLKEMIQDESVKKKREQSKSFKARPMPKSISKEKYQQFVNGMQHKLEEGRKKMQQLRSQSEVELQRLYNETKLFVSPKKKEVEQHYYQITARPPPESVLAPKLNQIEEQKETRRKKIMSQTQIKYQHSWKQLPLVAAQQIPKHQSPEKNEYKLNIRDIPDYRAEQLRIQRQLQEKKSHFHPTEPAPFFFRTEARHQHDHHSHSHSPSPPQCPEPVRHYDYKEIIYSQQPEIYYTQKFVDMVSANKKRAEQKEKKLKQQIQEETERQRRHDNFAKFMKSNLSKLPDTGKICQNEAKMKIERHKKYWKNLDRQHESNLNQLYAKILKRPFLYELQSTRPPKKSQPQAELPSKPKKAKAKQRKTINRSL